MDATVAVVRTRPETILEDYGRLMRLAGLDAPPASDAADARSLLLAETCRRWQIEGVARSLLAAGWSAADLAALVSGDASPDRGAAPGWARVLADCGIAGGLETTSPTSPPSRPLILSGLRTSRRLGTCGVLSTLAAHLLTREQREALDARPRPLVSAWPEPAGAVIDAAVCGDGPAPVAAQVLLAGRDAVAVEAMAAVLTGYDPRRLPLTAALDAAGLGCADPERIAIAGDADGVVPDLHLAEPAAYRGPRSDDGPGWFRRLTAGVPRTWTDRLRGRRGRQRTATMPWDRLEREYDRRGSIGGDEA